jgi:non-ribosomal peptide synthetase component E (peptide arylation enzyme)
MKISPTEIDLLLENYTGVKEAAVCAYPDGRMGEKICACLVMDERSPVPDVASMQEWLLASGLAKFKLPERIEVLDTLPRNALGKVQRYLLSDQVGRAPAQRNAALHTSPESTEQ